MIRKSLTLLAVVAITAASSQAAMVALKRDAGLNFTSPGNKKYTDARFDTATVHQVTVSDAFLYNAGAGKWMNYGALPGITNNMHYALYKFDVSALPGLAGATINLAQLRLYHNAGNGSGGSPTTVGQVVTHDWVEGSCTGATGNQYPGAAGGVSMAHPNGKNTTADRNANNGTTVPLQSWGVSSDSFFSPTGDGANARGLFKPTVAGADWGVFDVTSIVENWTKASNPNPNYGFYQYCHNYTWQFSEGNVLYEPVLFIDYTPVPEPATLALLALSGMMLVTRRMRRHG